MQLKKKTDRWIIARDRHDAVLFDMDGVITDTAGLHAFCWKVVFDEFLQKRATQSRDPFRCFDATDYKLYVDGKQRYKGVTDFLKSRGIELPEGARDDPPHAETVRGLGNRKNELVQARMMSAGVESYPGTVAFILYLRRLGIKTAVVTASENCETVLKAAKVADLFDAQVDGEFLAARNLAGKPAPDSFLQAAEMLQVLPERSIVVEDAIAGVRAGAQGGFALVIGVARKNNVAELKAHGADLVVHDLAELLSGFPTHRLEPAA